MRDKTEATYAATKKKSSIWLAIVLVVLVFLAIAVWGLFSLPAVFYLGLPAETAANVEV